MAHTDKRIEKALAAIHQKEKQLTNSFFGIGKRMMTKQQFAELVASQKNFILTNLLPPMFGINLKLDIDTALIAARNQHTDFTPSDVDNLLNYFDTQIYGVFQDADSSQEMRNRAFMRITGLAYMIEVLAEILVERDVIELDGKLPMQLKSHTHALMNFIQEVSERKEKTGKWALSGSNYREIDEFKEMAKGMMRGIWISEWYMAFSVVLYRFIANRLGCNVKDFT